MPRTIAHILCRVTSVVEQDSWGNLLLDRDFLRWRSHFPGSTPYERSRCVAVPIRGFLGDFSNRTDWDFNPGSCDIEVVPDKLVGLKTR